MIDTKKLLPHASKANTISDKSVENISTIASTLIDVDTIMKGSLLLEEMRRKKKAKSLLWIKFLKQQVGE